MTEPRESEAFSSGLTDEDWLNRGKADAWAGRPKTPPQHDARAASFYDLGYSEGEIERPPTETESSTENR